MTISESRYWQLLNYMKKKNQISIERIQYINMSYQYNKLVSSTIQQKKQKSHIFSIKHNSIQIDQIKQYVDQFLYFEDVQELGNKELTEAQQLNNLFLVLQQCHKFKKYLIIGYSPLIQKYLSQNHEFKNNLILFVNTEESQYRELSKQYSVQLIVRSRDLYHLLQRYPAESVIDYYKKSNKYIQTIFLSDFNQKMESVPPFEGLLFDLHQLHSSISIFYYILKQNFTFILDFKDNKKQIQTLINLAQNYIQIYDLIIASVHQDKDFFHAIKEKEDQKDPKYALAINRYKTKQSLMIFIQNISNQQTHKQILVFSNYWSEKNSPNEIVKYLIAVQIPNVRMFVEQYFKENSSKSEESDLKIKQIIKFAVPVSTIIKAFQNNQIPYIIHNKQHQLYTLKQTNQALDVFIKQAKLATKKALKFIQTGQVARGMIKNIENIEILVDQNDLNILIEHIDQIKSDDISIIQQTFKIVLVVRFENKQISLIIYPYNQNNKGILEVQYSSVYSFWITLTKYAQKKSIIFKDQNLFLNNELVPIKTEKQLFSTLGLKFIEPKNRISFQISDKYFRTKEIE